MGGYIKVYKALIEDPRLLDLAHILAARPESGCADPHVWHNALIGVVVRLWTYGDRWVDRGDKLPIRPETLGDILGTPEWIARLLPGDWLRINDGDSSVTLPGYCAKNGIDGRDERKEKMPFPRERWRLKKRRQRAKKPSNGHGGDTQGDIGGTEGGQSTPPVPGPVYRDRLASEDGLNGPSPPPPKKDPEIQKISERYRAERRAAQKGEKP
jgi:hypothetical protein